MKSSIFKIIGFTTLIISGVFASNGTGGTGGGPKQSWDEIILNPNLKPEFPIYNVKNHSIKYNHLCLSGDMIRSKYKYIDADRPYGNTLSFEYLFTEREAEIEVCKEIVDGTCVEWELEKQVIPTKDEIIVLKLVKEGERIYWVEDFRKTFELTECAN